MPTQLQLEGPDLETLLGRVKAEHGPGARIVRAEKVRTGGIAGFFAKERFEICVELDLTAPAAPLQPAPLLDSTTPIPVRPATSLLDLADQVSAAELNSHTRGGGAAAPTVRRRTDRPVDDRPVSGSPFDDSANGQPVGGRRASDHPAPSGRPSSPVSAPASSTAASSTAATASSPTPVSTETTSFAAVLERLGVAAGPADEPANEPATTPEPAPLPALPRQRAAFEPTIELERRRPVEVAVRETTLIGQPDDVCGQLAELGLPAHLLPVPAAGPVYPSLVESLRRLPRVPRASNRAGGVLVVVGPQALALEVAREIARDLKLPVATAVVLATPGRGRTELPAKQVIRNIAAATERRAAWRRRRNLTIVALDTPLTAAGAAVSRTFLQALQPSATWGVVEATRKAQDVGRWTRALGGVDALALAAVEETADPAAVLTLGIPVGRLGSTKATPAAWAALLTDRMAA